MITFTIYKLLRIIYYSTLFPIVYFPGLLRRDLTVFQNILKVIGKVSSEFSNVIMNMVVDEHLNEQLKTRLFKMLFYQI